MKARVLFRIGFKVVYTIICILLLADLIFGINSMLISTLSFLGNIMGAAPSVKVGIVLLGKVIDKTA